MMSEAEAGIIPDTYEINSIYKNCHEKDHYLIRLPEIFDLEGLNLL